MKKRLPPLNWLRSFEASARHLNFTLAASELHMTQAAVSQQIKGLETKLGCALFKRLPRGLELTDAGRAYIPGVRESIEKLALVTDEVFGKERSHTLTVRVNLVFFNTWLAPRLADFRNQYPDIDLRFTSNIWVAGTDKEADAEICYGKGQWTNCFSDRLTWDRLIPVCSPTLLDGQLPPADPSELSNYTLLHVIGYEEGWGFWLNQLGYYNIDPSQGIHFDSLMTGMEMAAQGHGVALSRTSLAANMLENGRLIAPFEQTVSTVESFYLTTPKDKPIRAHVDAFRQWIIDQAQQASPGQV
ncbi:transcriptional regulator GcvA [Porticoccaceae bacterium]|jgi:LysR family glycine cleavage system transcriptional activator|nr:transcriptional regulator GcvA [Porticoccaceae bacterium]MDA8735206.1 transcriptional regulator GcvA [Porticoccaceae bacterium]